MDLIYGIILIIEKQGKNMLPKIAIIDDEYDIANVLKNYLSSRKKFEVDIFTNPILAFESIINDSYDLILLDIMMPHLNGVELLNKIKINQVNAKVILMTAYPTVDTMRESYNIGACDYITKPFISLKNVELKILEAIEK